MRHRISPATVIASAALFFSASGTGIAASHYLITSASQIKPSVRHQLTGQRGPAGPAGPQGAQGEAGAPGAAGATGTQGPAAAADVVGSVTVHVLGNVQQVAPGQTLALTQTCGQNSVTGGGFTARGLTVEASNATVSYSDTGAPATYGWKVTVTNPGATTLPAAVSAVCN